MEFLELFIFISAKIIDSSDEDKFSLLPLMYLVTKASAIWLPLTQHLSSNGNKNVENCICPTESQTIINKLDYDKLGVERLVIFVYKNPNTGKIVSFIPEKELQRKFPDFPDTNGHMRDIEINQSIKEIFEKSPSKDIRGNIRHDEPMHKNKESIIGVKDKTPKDSNVNNNEKHSANRVKIVKWQIPFYDETFENRVENEYINSYPEAISGEHTQKKTEITIDNVQQSSKENRQDHISQESTIDISPEFIQEKYNTQGEYIVPGRPLKHDNMHDSSAQSILIQSIESQGFSEENKPEHATSNRIESSRQKLESSIEDHIHPFYTDTQSGEKQLFYDDQENIGTKRGTIKVPRKDKYGRIIGWTMKTITSYQDGELNTPDSWMKYRINKRKPISYHFTDVNSWEQDSAFDDWLIEQLKITTINGNKIPTSTTDIKALDKAIRNVLLQNGWLVTRWGTLIDGNGKTSSLDNLKLRPILVGKSYSYDRLTKKQNPEINLSRKRPYLEGLLLTMIKPAKILGIVPLSITSYSRPHKGKGNILGGSAKLKSEKSKINILPLEELVSFRKDLISSRHKLKGAKKIMGPVLLNNLLPDVHKSQQGKGPSTTIYQTKGKVRHNGNGYSIVSEEKPDWRIIGGNPAIISGSPLDFKGRSGLDG